jgi:hypothetical protein
LAELQTPDELALIFNPIGLGPPISPDVAADHQAQMIERAVLVENVPAAVRDNFERARKLHLYGLLEYEFFTAAGDYAVLVLEGALRLRFLSYYENKVPVFRGTRPGVIDADDFEPILRARGNVRLRRGDLREPLPRHLKRLLDWARSERLLPGRRTRIVDRALVFFRNHAAHPVDRTIDDPVGSARMLRDVAEYINCLWGVRAEDGRLFGGPLRRRARVAAVHPDGSSSAMDLHHVSGLCADEQEGTFAVFLAADDEALTLPFRGFAYQEGFQATVYPCDRLWAGGREELVARIEAGEFIDVEDRVEPRDRTFLVRAVDGGPDLARSPQDLLRCTDPPQGAWIAMVADDPHEAFGHVRDHEPGDCTGCAECDVEIAGRFGSTGEAVGFAREVAVDRPAPGSP